MFSGVSGRTNWSRTTITWWRITGYCCRHCSRNPSSRSAMMRLRQIHDNIYSILCITYHWHRKEFRRSKTQSCISHMKQRECMEQLLSAIFIFWWSADRSDRGIKYIVFVFYYEYLVFKNIFKPILFNLFTQSTSIFKNLNVTNFESPYFRGK